MNFDNILETITDFITVYGIKIIAAIVIWIVGSWVIRMVMKGLRKVMAKQNFEESLQKFLINLTKWTLKVLLFIIILSKLGVETTSFAAVLAAAGLAVGLALQGSLGNFAGGVLLMIFKPFKIGDLIEAQGELGAVKEIEIFTTKILTPQNKLVIIPNGALSNGNIINYSAEGKIRMDLTFGVSYDADIKQTKEVLMNVLTSQDKVMKDPAPSVTVEALNDSSVDFAVRPWVTVADYWDVYFATHENAKLELDAAGIEIPYPHSVEIQKQG